MAPPTITARELRRAAVADAKSLRAYAAELRTLAAVCEAAAEALVSGPPDHRTPQRRGGSRKHTEVAA